jgi:hypothetical protein
VGGAFIGFKESVDDRAYFYETKSREDGTYETRYLRQGTYFVDIQRPGFVDIRGQRVEVVTGTDRQENVAVSPPIGEGEWRIVLTWCRMKERAVRDVDSYLAIPGVTEPLAFRRVRTEYHGAHLDIDQTQWVGPETVTIRTVKSGTYIYYVNNYDNRGNLSALGHSDINVQVIRGNRTVKTYRVPEGKGLSYEVFRIENGELKDTGRWADELFMHGR